jgi:hypothetical protein
MAKLLNLILEDLEKLWRRFLWAGDKKLTEGKCIVHCTRAAYQKRVRLDIPNLENFTRTLQLRWLWHLWVSNDKPWVGIETPCDDEDELLFIVCTTINLGDRGGLASRSPAGDTDRRTLRQFYSTCRGKK